MRMKTRPTRTYRWLSAIGAMLLTLPGCHDSLEPCTARSVTVSVTAGRAPHFFWSPACAANGVHVVDAATRQGIWGVRTENSNSLRPGIQFGGAIPLVAGHSYIVSVDAAVSADELMRIGERTFTP
jgi:hypothetical protein